MGTVQLVNDRREWSVRDATHEVDVTLRMGSRFDVNQVCFVAPDGRRWRYLVAESGLPIDPQAYDQCDMVAVWVSDQRMSV